MQKKQTKKKFKGSQIFFSDEEIDKQIEAPKGKKLPFAPIETEEAPANDIDDGQQSLIQKNNYDDIKLNDAQYGESFSQDQMESDSEFHIYECPLQNQNPYKFARLNGSTKLKYSKEVRSFKNPQKQKPLQKDKHQVSFFEESEDPQKQEEPKSSQGELKNRKIRTTVNDQKIRMMEHFFPFIIHNKPYAGQMLSLKMISKIVNLGYSTVLHKYRDYRLKGKVQKGVLLKCKDFKRKYRKSLTIQNCIRKAMRERTFRSAIQLANYMKQKYKMNVNRSIISRHLNEMQRQKFEYIGEKEGMEIKPQIQSEQGETTDQHILLFSELYFGLKSQTKTMQYLSVIRLFFIEGKIQKKISKTSRGEYEILNVLVSCNQNKLIDFRIQCQKKSQNTKRKKVILDFPAYELLYKQLKHKIEEQQLSLSATNPQVSYLLFPFSNSKEQFQYRRKYFADLLYKRINLLVIPPHQYFKKINFIEQWFLEQVFPQIQQKFYDDVYSLVNWTEHYLMKKEQNLRKFAKQMVKKMQKIK